MSTKKKLAERLANAGAPDWMIAKAESGYYDDYESPVATPIIQLVIDCEAANLADVAEEARSGEFDGSKEESDAWYEREGRHLE